MLRPPDNHMLIREGIVRLSKGPRENHARPSIDVLFRSAITAGDNLTAVLLSGCLDDGVLGLTQISEAGGFIVVQRPSDALFPDLPQAGINKDHVNAQLSASEIAGCLIERTYSRRATVHALTPPQPNIAPVKNNEFGCPACGGILSMTDGDLQRYACMVGHTFGLESLLEEQSSQIENALWTAVRALEERTRLLERVSQRLSNTPSQQRIRDELVQLEENRQLLYDVLGSGMAANNEPATPGANDPAPHDIPERNPADSLDQPRKKRDEPGAA